MSNNGLTIALPSGKSLEEQTLAVLKAAHINILRVHTRLCVAEISGLPGITRAVFIKPSQIPGLVCNGDIPIGITGKDAVLEDGGNVKVLAELPYSRATSGGTRCVLFTREENSATKLLQNLEGGVIIISEYPKETEGFLGEKGVSASVHPCTGSAEALVAVGQYDYGVALTETGTSLRVNHLVEIATVFVSQTVLIVNEKLYKEDAWFRNGADFLGRILNGVLNARGNVYIVMNAPVENAEAICKLLPALKAPNVVPESDPAFCSIATVVHVGDINELKMQLEPLGATGFVELTPTSVQ
jgi:ATP phosphoribosyltransferase